MRQTKLCQIVFMSLLVFLIQVKAFGQVSAEWVLLENRFTQPDMHRAQITLTNMSDTPIEAGWKLYFNTIFLSVFVRAVSPELQINHLQGDFFVVEGQTPTILSGQLFPILYQSRGPFFKNSYAPEGLILLHSDGSFEEITTYQTQQLTTSQLVEMAGSSHLPIPSSSMRFEKNKAIRQLSENELPPFLPSPKSWTYQAFPLHIINPWIAIANAQVFPSASDFFQQILMRNQSGVPQEESIIPISFFLDMQLQQEAYKLKISGRKVSIEASTEIGAFYGMQSFLALLPPNFWQGELAELHLPQLSIEDEPGFGYRGLFLDVARNFQTKEQVMKLLDLMAFYKLNVFHFNLANDEGWRLEIPGLPELTAFGGRRGFSLDEADFLWPYYASGAYPENSLNGSGFYSESDFKEILVYAKERHIEVIPEFGVPAHSRAAILAMEKRYANLMQDGRVEEALAYRLADSEDESKYLSAQNFKGNTVCVCQESTYRFYEKLVSELVLMYKAAAVPLVHWHTGGDEVPRGAWKNSPICEAFLQSQDDVRLDDLNDYFRSRIADILQRYELQMSGWEEIGQRYQGEEMLPNPKFADRNWRLYAWNAVAGWGGEDMAYKLANAGYPVVICSSANFYFDLAYSWDPDERGHTWSGVVDMYQSWKTVPGKLYLSHDQTMDGGQWDWDNQASLFEKLTQEGRKNILGVSGQLWTETVKGPAMLEYYLLPKMLGYVERAWQGDPNWSESGNTAAIREQREQAWITFSNLIGQKEIPRLEKLFGGFQFQLPKPGIAVEGNKLIANAPLPGMLIRYTTDGTEPEENSVLYESPLPYGNGECYQFRIFLPSGKRGAATGVY